jgi:Flp pilus assembly protein TadD
MNAWKSAVGLAMPIALAVLLRAFHLVEQAAEPGWSAPDGDALYNALWARGIALGEWHPPADFDDPAIPSHPYFRPPGYAFFLAAIYRTLGTSPWGPFVVQCALGVINVVLVWLLARRIGGPWAAAAAALFAGSAWTQIYFEAQFMETALTTTLLLLVAYALARLADRFRFPLWTCVGFLLGLSALVRTNAFLVAGAVLALAVLKRPFRGSFRPASAIPAFFLALAIPVLPAAWRNFRISGEWVPVATNFGVNFFIGNNERASGTFDFPPDAGRFGSCFDWTGLVRLESGRAGRTLTHAEVSDLLARRAWRFIRDCPGAAARLWIRRALMLVGNDELAHNTSIRLDRVHSRTLSAVPGNIALVLALTAAGWVARTLAGSRAAKDAGAGAWVACVGVSYAASYLPFFVSSQYRSPLVPFLAIGAGCGAVSVWNLMRARRARALLAAAAGAGLYAFSIFWPAVPADPQLEEAWWRFGRGNAWRRAGHPAEAAAEYRRAIETRPDYVEALNNLGIVLRDLGRVREAEAWWRRALERGAGSSARANLADLLLAESRPDEAAAIVRGQADLALDQEKLLHRIGVALALDGRWAESRAFFEDRLRINPESATLANDLAWLLATSPRAEVRDGPRAMALAEKICAAHSGNPAFLDTLAAACAEQGDFKRAASVASEALSLMRSRGDPEIAAEIEMRLALYGKRQPYRSAPADSGP